ncbi:MAG TPA: LLM class F420-dependent oxidoreductase [Actinomycetota bacterium]|jgi:probable F420-dependent oxidoreductase|nr:LLM class F420-dependent oxidoreductase [Actinomycetota bacterium]
MDVGLFAPLANPWGTREYLATLASAAEERGFSSIWVAEHVVLFDEYASRYPYAADGKIPAGGESGIFEPFTTLAFLAAHSSTIRLGTGICLVPQRNPVYTAKEVAAVDWLSNGRLDFGVGVGWLAEEFEAVAVPFERRDDRCREYLDVMRALWCDPISEYKGEFYELKACRQYPKPIQQPHPRIHFGGETNAALRRVADHGTGWYGFSREPEQVPERIAMLERLLGERGRTRDEIQVSICPYLLGADPDKAKRYVDAGVDQLILMAFAPTPDALVQTLDGLAATFVEPVRTG